MKNKKMLHSRLIDWCLTPTLAVFLAISWREVSHNRVVLKSNLATGQWFSPGTPVSYTNKTDRHNITEILMKVALNTINPSTREE
jgi:hypothetical protein